VPPDGHEAAAAVVVGTKSVAVGVAAAEVAATIGDDVDGVLELPHAARVAAHATMVRGIQAELLRVTCNASVNRSRLSVVHYEPSRCHFEETVTMEDHADPVPGPQSSNEEPQAHLTPTPHGGGWRMLSEPVEVEAFLGQTWVTVVVDGFDKDSAEIWARWPPQGHTSGDVHHQVIDASHYRPPKGGFPAG
jgi:hypothetical protein